MIGGACNNRAISNNAWLHTNIYVQCFWGQVIKIICHKLTHWGYIAPFLFNLSHYFEFSSSVEWITRSSQQLHQVICHISSANINSLYGSIDRKAFKNWGTMAYTIATVQDDTSCFSLSIQAQDSLGLEKDAWWLEFFEEELSCLLSIWKRIQWGFCEKNWMLFWRYFQ